MKYPQEELLEPLNNWGLKIINFLSSNKIHKRIIVLSQNKSDFARDLIFWRNKRLNILVLLVATATWVVLDIYGYNFITVASWVAMALVSFTFLWGNIHKLLVKKSPDLSGMEISEETAVESAKLLREQVEKCVRLMFQVGAEKEGFVFTGVVACLYALSLIGNCFDLLILCYIGAIGGLTVPVTSVKYEHKIKEYGERLKMKLQRLHVKKMKNIKR
ncbi:unnamed protein product [Fraxinus pennsylvanica]|uniref:Reticulon-like protein n=1 Tax=Fraxinus pennsylvanica TaxID=56036 RepID=A0AAD1YPX2_9LAMI|nr:unnamed protein product [Fraxinus pennsylvanica]